MWGAAAANVALAMVCLACGAGQTEGGDQVAQEAGRLRAVATVFPLAWIVEQIAPEAEIVFLGQSGQEPHDMELSPGDRQAVETAEVVLYMGDIGFQPQVEQAAASARGEVLAVSEVVGEDALHAGEAHAHEGEPRVTPGPAPEAETVDPHVWFDAGLMARVAERTGEAFAAADPDRAQMYEANAVRVSTDLVALNDEIGQILAGCRFNEAIVSHEAYAYLLEPHGLEQHGIAGSTPEAGASPAQLAELSAEIRTVGIPAVLVEPVEGRADAETLAKEAGVRLLEVNPLEVVSPEEHEVGYAEMLRRQAQTFAQALECAGGK